MSPDIDAVDQGGKKGTLLCSRHLGPALADFQHTLTGIWTFHWSDNWIA
jgi:hypothetical protein